MTDNKIAEMLEEILCAVEEGGDNAKKFEEAKARAEKTQKDAESQFQLAEMYYNGKGVKRDYKEAAKHYEKAAYDSHPKARNKMGWIYYLGQGFTQNYTEAFQWFQRTVSEHAAETRYGFGLMHLNGHGTPKNCEEAIKWLKRAGTSENASVDAQFKLGCMYYSGTDVDKDEGSAYNWLSLAASSGHKEAIALRDSIAKEMGADKTTEQQKNMQMWLLNNNK